MTRRQMREYLPPTTAGLASGPQDSARDHAMVEVEVEANSAVAPNRELRQRLMPIALNHDE